MQDFEELKKAKQRCVDELVEALPRYRERLDEIDHRLVEYIEDALINNASHANLYELLGIRKELRLMDSYDLDPERVKRSLRAIEGQWANGRHVNRGSSESHDASINGKNNSPHYQICKTLKN